MTVEALFWASAAFLLYVLLLYPGLMALLGACFAPRIRRQPITPGVSLIIAACNEDRYIARMMEQVLRTDYPRELLDVVVASDEGSTDRTHAIVRSYEPAGIRLLLPEPGAVGKNVSLDAAVQATRGEILVFADATAIWEPDCLRKLAADFADPRVGCVSARKAYWLEDGFGPGSYRGYWSVEGLVDAGSSLFGYVPNASGGLHALRRSIYEVVPNYMIRDLVDPAQAAGAGYLSVLDPAIRYLDAPWVGSAEVYRSRVRITMRALSSTRHILGRLLRGRRYVAAFQFVSHKLLRWFLWLPAAGLLISSLWPGARPPAFVALAQLLLYASVPVALTRPRLAERAPALAHWAFFVLSLVAMAHGFGLWASGRKKATWRLRPPGLAAANILSAEPHRGDPVSSA
jgi:cellulose synthase/poly-beta-1,6-N-acetylglucosamine synthase-like glycosyltransferase